MTLEKMIEQAKTFVKADDMWSMKACKDIIRLEMEREKCSYFTLLERYYERQRDGKIYNPVVILACWELINGE